MRCPDCESIENHLFDETTFWLSLPTTEGFGKVATLCGNQGISAKQFGDKGITLTLQRDEIERFLTSLYGDVNRQELAFTQVLTTETNEIRPVDIGRVLAADTFIYRFQSQWLIDAIEKEAYTSWYQPIVDAKDPGTTYAHEALLRVKDQSGTIIPPSHVFKLAAHSDLLFTLDLAARRCAVETAARHKLPGKLFINFNPSSVYDPAYCLRTTAATINELGMKPEDVVFEITESHEVKDKAHLKGLLAFYRNAGFGVALDDIGSGWSGLNMLHELRPDYVKLDMDLIRDIDTDQFKQSIVEHIISLSKRNGIKTLAEGIETDGEFQWLQKTDVDFLQGYLFGKPLDMNAQKSR